MNGNSSVANLLFTNKEPSGARMRPPMPGSDSSFHSTLETSIARYEPPVNQRPPRSETRNPPRDNDKGAAPDREVNRDQRESREPVAKTDDDKNWESADKTRARENERPENNNRTTTDDARDNKSAVDGDKSAENKTTAKDEAEPSEKKDSRTSEHLIPRKSFLDEPVTREKPEAVTGEQSDAPRDILNVSLAAGREFVKQLTEETKSENRNTRPAANHVKTDAEISAAKTDKDIARTIESMVANLLQDNKLIVDKNGKSKSAKSGAKNSETAKSSEDNANKRAAKEPVVNVQLDENKWKVAGDVAREGRNPTGEIKLDSEPSKYAKTANRNNTNRAAEARVNVSETSRDTGGMEVRTGIESADIRREASFEVRRAAAEQKSHMAENRKAFNELVEKARLNLGPDGRSSASIRLNPPHLGRMTMNLQLNNNHLQAKVLVENQEARRMLMDDMEFLQRELRIHGIQVESFSVRVREPQSAQDATNQHADNKGSNASAADGDGDSKDTGDKSSSEDGDSRGGNNNEINEDVFETAIPGRKNAGLVNISV